MKRLCIISHTEHYRRADGTILGLASTVQELNELIGLFDTIVHIAVLYPIPAPLNTMPYNSNAIKFVALSPTGGKNLGAKFRVLWTAPKVLRTIANELKGCDYFQFRAPTGIGTYVIPYLILFARQPGWFKYAGNWQQESAPLSYRFQRWLLKQQNRPVTINGQWPEQPAHCKSFENPCVTGAELQEGLAISRDKSWNPNAIELCFVGRMEVSKGVLLFMEALEQLPKTLQAHIQGVHMVGIGEELAHLKARAAGSTLNFKFYGLLDRVGVQQVYKTCQAVVLPSTSEGFPKVIAESMNYGCVPLVSNVSAIGQYIKDRENGFLIKTLSASGVGASIEQFMGMDASEFKTILNFNSTLVQRFTYRYYREVLKSKILLR